MERKQRTKILIKGSTEIPQRLAKEIIDQYDVEHIEEPNHGLIMVKMREIAQKSLFYLGEIFVTECKVRIHDVIGIGIVRGDQPKLAYELAVIDAAYNAGLKETKDWKELLLAEEQKIQQKKNQFKSKVLKTKVNFETLDDDE